MGFKVCVDCRTMIVMSIATRDSNNDLLLAVYVMNNEWADDPSTWQTQSSMEKQNCTCRHRKSLEDRNTRFSKSALKN